MPNLDDALAQLDQTMTRAVEAARIPGAAWGVVTDGRLAHAGATGTVRAGEDRRPDADTVFRIASMTKSFTAATTLLLRDEGRLRLDDAAADHVPALRGWRPRTADAPPITVRDLLSMASGLATDDPWGDRQQGLPLDQFEAFLAAGPSLALPAGVVFEYSNLGYGILGRVITSAAGAEYREVVRDRVLRPLGMDATGYREEEVPDDRLAHGYVRFADELVREGRDGYGALAAMGGIFTTVRDLATWVAGFLDAFPARDDPEGAHPLRRASRREMQQAHRAFGAEIGAHAPDAVPGAEAGGRVRPRQPERRRPRHDSSRMAAGIRASGRSWRGIRRAGSGSSVSATCATPRCAAPSTPRCATSSRRTCGRRVGQPRSPRSSLRGMWSRGCWPRGTTAWRTSSSR
ncbi:MAG: serine hydrolase domain-containing protein [Chloroflexota bacterium]